MTSHLITVGTFSETERGPHRNGDGKTEAGVGNNELKPEFLETHQPHTVIEAYHKKDRTELLFL